MLAQKLESFEKAFDFLNRELFESQLSKSVITITPTPGAYGHFSCGRIWEDGQARYHEINLGAEDINRPLPNVVATLVHEMVHQYCHEEGIKDTSRGGTYHNKRFRDEASRRGLIINRHDVYGWTITEPGEEVLQMVASGEFAAVECDLHRIKRNTTASGNDDEGEGKPGKRWHRYECPKCGAWVRSNSEVRIRCEDCDAAMEEPEES